MTRSLNIRWMRFYNRGGTYILLIPIPRLDLSINLDENIFVEGINEYMPEIWKRKTRKTCMFREKCGGTGWVFWDDLDNYDGPAKDGSYSDDTKYSCDVCHGESVRSDGGTMRREDPFYEVTDKDVETFLKGMCPHCKSRELVKMIHATFSPPGDYMEYHCNKCRNDCKVYYEFSYLTLVR